jgi:hypothetical protein
MIIEDDVSSPPRRASTKRKAIGRHEISSKVIKRRYVALGVDNLKLDCQSHTFVDNGCSELRMVQLNIERMTLGGSNVMCFFTASKILPFCSQ